MIFYNLYMQGTEKWEKTNCLRIFVYSSSSSCRFSILDSRFSRDVCSFSFSVSFPFFFFSFFFLFFFLNVWIMDYGSRTVLFMSILYTLYTLWTLLYCTEDCTETVRRQI